MRNVNHQQINSIIRMKKTGGISIQVEKMSLRFIPRTDKIDRRESIGWVTKRGGPALYSNRVVSTPPSEFSEGVGIINLMRKKDARHFKG